jgi:hypothetical protein
MTNELLGQRGAPSVVTSRGELSTWVERRVRDVVGEPIGVVVDVYRGAASDRPVWLAIDTGGPHAAQVVAPVRGASLLGEDVVIAYDRHAVITAPSVDAVVTLEPSHEHLLSTHYTRAVHPAGTQSRRIT